MENKLKKGFTLIEMIISVTLLAFIAVIIMINLNKNIKDQKAKEYAEFVEKVKAAANIYMAANPDSEAFAKDENGYNIISIELLEESGLLSADSLIDPETNLRLSDESTDVSKKYIKIYDDEKLENNEKSEATLIEYPATGEINKYIRTVEYEMNGFGSCNTQKPVVGETISICNPTDDNATFVKWFLDSELSSEGPNGNDEYKPMEDVKFYAKWYKNKSSTIRAMKIESATSNHDDYKVKVTLDIIDVYGGKLKVCLSKTNNMDTCQNWEEIDSIKDSVTTYTKEVNLQEMFDSSYTTGSGKSAKLYAFVQNTAYEEALKERRSTTNLVASAYKTYKIYLFCTEVTVTSEGTYGDCSAQCGGGTKSRMNKVKDKYYDASYILCADSKEETSCNTMDCCSRTVKQEGTYGACSAKCGGGTQSMTINYVSAYDSSKVCSSKTETKQCNTQDCCSSTYASYSYGSCSASCGSGSQSVTITYYSSYDNRYCKEESTSQTCNAGSCCPNNYKELYSGGFSCYPVCYTFRPADNIYENIYHTCRDGASYSEDGYCYYYICP